MAKQKVLITGGAGFIGSHLASYHLTKGDEVWALDNLRNTDARNIKSLQTNSAFTFNEVDVCQWSELPLAAKWADKIYHLAADVGQRLVLEDPLHTLKNNIDSGERILEAMDSTNSQAPILFSSTSEVYFHSIENQGDISEKAVLSFISGRYLQEPYPLSKLVNEVMALGYTHKKNLKCTIARIFNTIGPNQSKAYGFVVPRFIHQALTNAPLTVYGSGSQTRSFCNVKDTIKALDLLIENPKSIGEIVNVGSEQECSILNLAKLIIKLTKSQSEIQYVPIEQVYGKEFEDVRNRRPNLTKLKNITGFQSKYTLEQTLLEIIESTKNSL